MLKCFGLAAAKVHQKQMMAGNHKVLVATVTATRHSPKQASSRVGKQQPVLTPQCRDRPDEVGG